MDNTIYYWGGGVYCHRDQLTEFATTHGDNYNACSEQEFFNEHYNPTF